MAFNIGQAFGGLAQGLAEGIPEGIKIARQQQDIKLRDAQFRQSILKAAVDMRALPPEDRKVLGPALGESWQTYFGKPMPMAIGDIIAKGNDAQVKALSSFIGTYFIKNPGANKEKFVADLEAASRNPATMISLAKEMREGEHQEKQLKLQERQVGISAYNAATSRMSVEESRAERAERKRERDEATTLGLHEKIIDNYKDSLNPEDRPKFAAEVAKDAGYRMAARLKDRQAMDERAALVYQRNPTWQNQQTRTKKIEAAMRSNPSLKREDAEGIVDGYIKMEVVPGIGSVRLTDVRKGTAREVPLAPGTPETPEAPPTPTKPLYESAREGDIAGIGSGVVDIWSRTVGQLGIRLPGQEQTLKARQDASLVGRDLIRALQNNPRFPEGERKSIAEEISIESSAWDSRDALTARMQSINVRMRERLRDAERAARNPNMPQEMRSTQIQAAEAIRNFLRKLGAPPPNLPPSAKRVGMTKGGFYVYEIKDKSGETRRVVDEY
jgi:hypothetical protein